MADSYKYNYTLDDGAGGYIRYNISPDYGAGNGSGIAAGEYVQVAGVVRSNASKINSVAFDFTCNGNTWTSSWPVAARKGQEKKFAISFLLREDMYPGADRGAFITVRERAIYPGSEAGYRVSGSSAEQSLIYLRYRLNLQVISMRVGRCDDQGRWDSQGDRIRCANFRMSCDSRADTGKLHFFAFGIEPDEGWGNMDVGQTPVDQAIFTEEGYSDPEAASGRMFGSYTAERTTGCTLMFQIGDTYEITTFRTEKIPPAFARLHLSGAAKGGVGIGMFSTSTDDAPKFEVSETHESHFYGPAYFEGGIGGVSLPVGFATIILENTSSSAKEVSGHIPRIQGANSYLCTGVLGWSTNGRPGVNSAPSISGTTLTATLAANSTVMFGILGMT